jgi:hypothetical protein
MELFCDSNISSSPHPVLLPNAEVLQMLQKSVEENKRRLAKIQKAATEQQQQQRQQQNSKKQSKRLIVPANKFEHRDWIEEKVLNYLKKTPCVHLPVHKLQELKSKCTTTTTTMTNVVKQRRGHSSGHPSTNLGKRARTALGDDPHAATSSSNIDNDTTSVSATIATSKSYGLTEAETIQVLNFMPQEPVEMHLLVEDLHSRMSEKQQEEFLDMIELYSSRNKSLGDNSIDNKTLKAEVEEELELDFNDVDVVWNEATNGDEE